MQAKDLIKEYLSEAKTMQLATVGEDGKPWVCTVHFVADKSGNIYWLSLPSRRHSREVMVNENVAIAIVIKSDFPVIGVQAEGVAKEVKNLPEIAKIILPYVKKFGIGKDFYKRVVSGKNNHRLYKFEPIKFYLFDEVNFPGGVLKEREV